MPHIRRDLTLSDVTWPCVGAKTLRVASSAKTLRVAPISVVRVASGAKTLRVAFAKTLRVAS